MTTVQELARAIVAREGGFVDDPDDPGGATNFGVTIGTMRRLGVDLTGDGRVNTTDLRALTVAQAVDIYVKHYFDRPGISQLPQVLHASVFDMYVNAGAGAVKILRFVAAQDVGRAIHRSYVEGQMHGGVVQGIGWALNEEYIYNQQGRLANAGFLDYRIPVASDLPMIEAVIVEVPNPNHPFGVKGAGEVSIVPAMAAVANAIADAVGRRMTELPMSPPKVLAAIDTP